MICHPGNKRDMYPSHGPKDFQSPISWASFTGHRLQHRRGDSFADGAEDYEAEGDCSQPGGERDGILVFFVSTHAFPRELIRPI